jgi:hypothetical protein
MASENGPVLRVRPAGLAAALRDGLTLAGGRPAPRLVAVDLDGLTPEEIHVPPARRAGTLVVGTSTTALPVYAAALCSSFDLTLLPEEHERSEISWQVGVPDVAAAIATLTDTVTRFPTAAHTLTGLLRLTAASSAEDGLTAESIAYSMLMAGDEHAGWLAGRSRREIPPAVEPVSLERTGGVLTVALNRPERHNAFGRDVRDGLVDAFDLVAADDSIERVRLIGKGPSFCSGGDLDEFGLTSDVTVAHLVRVDRSVAARLDAVRERVEVELHGACIGAGIELSSFAGRVVARPGTRIQLPELAMGLVPGAGGTVGITRRIGRWRTAWVVLSGEPLLLDTAVRWGLVDELVP